MNNQEVQKLVQLRRHIIEYYDRLEGQGSNIAVTNTKEIAIFCESLVKSVDQILSNYVNFEKGKK